MTVFRLPTWIAMALVGFAAAVAPAGAAQQDAARSPGVVIPLAPVAVDEATERTASATLQLPDGMVLTGWTFEPGAVALVDRVDLEVGTRWVGTWTPGDTAIEFPANSGVPLTASTLFTARVTYRAPDTRTFDQSGVRIWIVQDTRPNAIHEITVVRSWRTTTRVEIVALRPTRAGGEVTVTARAANGRTSPVAVLTPPTDGPQPTYRLTEPVSLPAGVRVETTGPVRLLYSADARPPARRPVRKRRRR